MFEGFYYQPKLTYAEAFAFYFTCTTLVYGVSALVGSYLCDMIIILIKRTLKNKYSAVKQIEKDSHLNAGSYNDMQTYLNGGESEKSQKGKQIAINILRILSFLTGWYSLLCIAITPSILSGLDVIPVVASVFITLFIFLVNYLNMVLSFYRNIPSKSKEDLENHSCFSAFRRKVIVTFGQYKCNFIFFAAFALVYSIAVPLLTENTCLNYFNEGYGVQFMDYGLSTKFSRYFQLSDACPQGKICHLYSTVAEDASTSNILNVHTGADVTSITIGYDLASNVNAQERNSSQNVGMLANTLIAKSYYLGLESRGDRYVHAAYLSGLQPNTEYYFEVYFNNQIQATGNFQTLPDKSMERNILIAAGGDVGTSHDAREMTALLGNYPVDLILVGGDLGYDNGIRSCYPSLDIYLNMFESLNNKFGRLVPMMVSVGNHDLGFNAFQGTQIDISQNLYTIYFPQHSKLYSNGSLAYQAPDPSERVTYAYHKIGNTVHLSLDSGYILPYDGIQIDFIKNISTQNPDLVKLANFHVPMYPTCFNPAYDDPRTLSVPRETWAPLFEQYKFASIFENHVHLYKKSYPLVGGEVNETGVMYFGDGNWGISPDSCYNEPGALNGNLTGILEAYSDDRHVWFINITKDFLVHYAINETNQMFDKQYSLNVTNYV